MNKHYIITDGEYSDYHIVTVFSEKEKAEKYVALYGGDIQEFDDGEVPTPYLFSVVINRAGEIVFEKEIHPSPSQVQESRLKPQERYLYFLNHVKVARENLCYLQGGYHHQYKGKCWKCLMWPQTHYFDKASKNIEGLEVWGNTLEAARKIAAEKWAECKAIMGDKDYLKVELHVDMESDREIIIQANGDEMVKINKGENSFEYLLVPKDKLG